MDTQTSDSSSVSARLRVARERLGWTREALAFHSGLSWSAIAQVETGRRTNVRPRTLAALSEALGVTIDYLVQGAVAPRPMLEHLGYFYDDDDDFKETMGSFMAAGLARSEAVAVVSTAGNIELLREHLGKDARSVTFVESSDQLTSPADALDWYWSFSDRKLRAGAPWIQFIAEPLWTRSEPEVRLWTNFESLVNVLFGTSPVTFVCPYDKRSLSSKILREAHRTHPGIVDADGISKCSHYSGPGRLALDL